MAVPQDDPLFYREDMVRAALNRALMAAVEENGQAAKAFAWDVSTRFKRFMDEERMGIGPRS